MNALADLPPETKRKFAGFVVGLLSTSRFSKPSRWPLACIVLTPERREVLHRMIFASELREAGLVEAAPECTARRVGPGESLLYILADEVDCAGAAFLVIDVRRGLLR